MMNVKKRPFTDPKVRRAIYLALDRQQLNEILEDNTGGVPSIFGGKVLAVLPLDAVPQSEGESQASIAYIPALKQVTHHILGAYPVLLDDLVV